MPSASAASKRACWKPRHARGTGRGGRQLEADGGWRLASRSDGCPHVTPSTCCHLPPKTKGWTGECIENVWLERGRRRHGECRIQQRPGRLRIVPGELRTSGVMVGRHVPPNADELPSFLLRFEEAYAPERLSRVHRILAVAAAHHRLLWIHPFFDGNGRVARLMSHAMLLRYGVGSRLWSAARGLARNAERYKAALARVAPRILSRR